MTLSVRTALLRAGAELLFWFLLPVLFLADYLLVWHRPVAAAIEHLYFLGLAAGALVVARSLLLRHVPTRPARLLASAVMGAALFSMLVYYSLVILILRAWGRVVTSEVIATYSGQLVALCETMGLNLPLAMAGLVLLFLLCWALAHWCLRHLFWMAAPTPRRLTDMLLAAMLVFTCYHAVIFTDAASTVSEPLRLTLWSGKMGTAARNYSQGLTVPASFTARERLVEQQYVPAAAAPHTNLVLIVVDALRFDHMGVNGYVRPTTPFLATLAGQGKLGISPRIHASCSETTCALASLAASRYSHDMPERPFTLTKLAQRNGYRTQMIMGDIHPEPALLYGKVDDFFDGSKAHIYPDDDIFIVRRTGEMAPWDGRALMLQYHLMAAHTLGRKYQRFWKYLPAERYAGVTSGPPVQRYTNYYDAGVLQADDEIGQLLTALKAKGYLRDALVVITADHGEGLGEHNKVSHTNSVYEELLHIPLLMLRYRDNEAQAAPAFERVGSQIDIAPTIAYELGLPIPASWSGAPLQLGQAPPFTYYQMVPYLGLYDHRDSAHLWKFFINLNNQEEFAFDLSTDPAEKINRAGQVSPALLRMWRARLQAVDRSIDMQINPAPPRPLTSSRP